MAARRAEAVARCARRRIVELIVTRERAASTTHIVLAEGLAEMLPHPQTRDLPRDDHGHLSPADRSRQGVAQLVTKRYEQRTGAREATGLQLGYESRCAPRTPSTSCSAASSHRRYRALIERPRRPHGSVEGHSICRTYRSAIWSTRRRSRPRSASSAPAATTTGLARFLETRTDKIVDWSPGRRPSAELVSSEMLR